MYFQPLEFSLSTYNLLKHDNYSALCAYIYKQIIPSFIIMKVMFDVH
jgi:hypothetical protein